MSVTFDTGICAVESEVLNSLSADDVLKSAIGRQPESYALEGAPANPARWSGAVPNALVAAVAAAYDRHLPLVLRPDDFWMCMLRGLAIHVAQDPEAHRSKFVDFDGIKTLTVRRDGFVKGYAGNDWPGVFAEFSDQIRGWVGGHLHEHLMSPFSTTGPAMRAAFDVALMETTKAYFKFRCVTCCGLPRITLEGTPGDWAALQDRALDLKPKFGLDWWIDPLAPVLQSLFEAVVGEVVDVKFWRTCYNATGGSGDPKVSGWLALFFPYATTYKGGYCVNPAVAASGARIDAGRIPPAVASAPMLWQYGVDELPYELHAGLFGVQQDPETGAVSTLPGWAVLPAA